MEDKGLLQAWPSPVVLIADNARLGAKALSVAWATLLLTRLLLVEVALLPSAGSDRPFKRGIQQPRPSSALCSGCAPSPASGARPPETKCRREQRVVCQSLPRSLSLSSTLHPSFPCRSSFVSFSSHFSLFKLLSSPPISCCCLRPASPPTQQIFAEYCGVLDWLWECRGDMMHRALWL